MSGIRMTNRITSEVAGYSYLRLLWWQPAAITSILNAHMGKHYYIQSIEMSLYESLLIEDSFFLSLKLLGKLKVVSRPLFSKFIIIC